MMSWGFRRPGKLVGCPVRCPMVEERPRDTIRGAPGARLRTVWGLQNVMAKIPSPGRHLSTSPRSCGLAPLLGCFPALDILLRGAWDQARNVGPLDRGVLR